MKKKKEECEEMTTVIELRSKRKFKVVNSDVLIQEENRNENQREEESKTEEIKEVKCENKVVEGAKNDCECGAENNNNMRIFDMRESINLSPILKEEKKVKTASTKCDLLSFRDPLSLTLVKRPSNKRKSKAKKLKNVQSNLKDCSTETELRICKNTEKDDNTENTDVINIDRLKQLKEITCDFGVGAIGVDDVGGARNKDSANESQSENIINMRDCTSRQNDNFTASNTVQSNLIRAKKKNLSNPELIDIDLNNISEKGKKRSENNFSSHSSCSQNSSSNSKEFKAECLKLNSSKIFLKKNSGQRKADIETNIELNECRDSSSHNSGINNNINGLFGSNNVSYKSEKSYNSRNNSFSYNSNKSDNKLLNFFLEEHYNSPMHQSSFKLKERNLSDKKPRELLSKSNKSKSLRSPESQNSLNKSQKAVPKKERKKKKNKGKGKIQEKYLDRDGFPKLKKEDYLFEKYGKKGWQCQICNNFNFENRNKCNKCKAIKQPKSIAQIKRELSENPKILEERAGDWQCPLCNNLNFAFRNLCNRCGLSKEKYLLRNLTGKR